MLMQDGASTALASPASNHRGDVHSLRSARKDHRAGVSSFCQNVFVIKIGSAVFNGQLFSNTKDTTVTKGKPIKSSFFSLFVYFVVRLFTVNYGRT
jgi:hypothetical protein